MSIIALVGRPNVGKSSLFNRLIGKRLAIVDDIPGVTRDRLYGEAEWDGKRFYLVDTGGIEASSPHPFEKAIEHQVRIALEESDGVVFILDGKDGVTPGDEAIADRLRRAGKPVVVAMNKLDNDKRDENLAEAYALGFPCVLGMSVEHNRNMGDLLDEISALLPEAEPEERSPDEPVRVALVGRPNVGKSSLFNSLLGEERTLVSDIPGTTRDTVDSLLVWKGMNLRIMDTAGLRRKSRVDGALEYYSTVRTFQAVDRSDVTVVLLDAQELLAEQDKRLVGHVLDRGKGLVLGVNKWDLLPPTEDLGDRIRDRIREELPLVRHAPVVFLSAKTGRGVQRVLPYVKTVDENRRRHLKTSVLNKLVRETLEFERMPGDGKGHFLKILYLTQAETVPPTFLFFVNDRRLVERSFIRRLDRLLRELDDFSGTPLRIWFRDRENQETSRPGRG